MYHLTFLSFPMFSKLRWSANNFTMNSHEKKKSLKIWNQLITKINSIFTNHEQILEALYTSASPDYVHYSRLDSSKIIIIVSWRFAAKLVLIKQYILVKW